MRESRKGSNLGDPRGELDGKWNDGSVSPIGKDTKHVKGLINILGGS
jgi:hypothetical protein